MIKTAIVIKNGNLNNYLTYPENGDLCFTNNIKQARKFGSVTDIEKCLLDWELSELNNYTYLIMERVIIKITDKEY